MSLNTNVKVSVMQNADLEVPPTTDSGLSTCYWVDRRQSFGLLLPQNLCKTFQLVASCELRVDLSCYRCYRRTESRGPVNSEGR